VVPKSAWRCGIAWNWWPKDKSCEHKDKACHVILPLGPVLTVTPKPRRPPHSVDGSTSKAVRLLQHGHPTTSSQEMVRWADVVVGDYNYYFDRSAMLYTR
jgi:DNA excision repair protein ERCC-2